MSVTPPYPPQKEGPLLPSMNDGGILSPFSEHIQTETSTSPVVRAANWREWRDEAGFPLLPDEQPVNTVRDSLYDLIPLGAREVKLISSEPFLRLQQVKQLGFVYRIW